MSRDNKDATSGAGWMILKDGESVVLCNQRNGEESTGRVEFTRKDFNALVDWWNRPQPIKRGV